MRRTAHSSWHCPDEPTMGGTSPTWTPIPPKRPRPDQCIRRHARRSIGGNQRGVEGAGRLARAPALRARAAGNPPSAPGRGGDGSAPSPDRPAAGPVKERLKMLAGAVVVTAVCLALIVVFSTVHSLYKGTRSGW